MATSFQLFANGQAADPNLTASIAVLEVEEDVAAPGAIQITLPVDRNTNGELTYITQDAFKPLSNLAVTASASATSATECIFDGVVLSQKLHLEAGIVHSTVRIWGQDYSWMMNLEEKAKEWVNVTDAIAAQSIFGSYGITPSPDNSNDDSPTHTEQGHSLMQRGTDAQFLRDLARRNGKYFRVAGGSAPGQRVGYFAKPNLSGSSKATLTLTDINTANITGLELDWDVMRPTSVKAAEKLTTSASPSSVSGDASDSASTKLSAQDLPTFAGKPMTVMLTTLVDDAGELGQRSKAVLSDAEWFIKLETETDVNLLGVVPRVGQIYQLAGLGSWHSGSYYLWTVRHTITPDYHKARLTLVRNSIGNTPSNSTGLSGLLP